MILHFWEEKEKWIFFSQGSRREREIPRKILHFREEKEILFLRGEREISRREIETHHPSFKRRNKFLKSSSHWEEIIFKKKKNRIYKIKQIEFQHCKIGLWLAPQVAMGKLAFQVMVGFPSPTWSIPTSWYLNISAQDQA